MRTVALRAVLGINGRALRDRACCIAQRRGDVCRRVSRNDGKVRARHRRCDNKGDDGDQRVQHVQPFVPCTRKRQRTRNAQCGENDRDDPSDTRRPSDRLDAKSECEGPDRWLVRGGHRDTQHSDDGDDRDSGDGFERRSAQQRVQRDEIPRDDARRQTKAVGRRERHHREEHRELHRQQPAIFGSEQGRDIADQVPRIDQTRHGQRTDACNAQCREASYRGRANVDRCDCRGPPRAREQQHEPRQRAEPRSGRQQVDGVGSDARIPIGSFAGRRMSCERERREIESRQYHRAERRR